MSSKYNFDKQLRSAPSAVFSKRIIPVANFFIPMLPKCLDKKQVTYRRGKVGTTSFHMLSPSNNASNALPCLFYIHGGGFAYKESFVHYRLEQAYCIQTPCVVFSVDYPVLPKAKYPVAVTALQDCYEYMTEHADELGIDIGKMAIGGDSAGGNLALETAIAVASTDLPQPTGLMTIYPVVDDRQNTKSMQMYVDTPLWNSVCNQKMWQWYLDGQTYVSPLQRLDKLTVRHLFVETEQYDCLHDEGIALYQAASSVIGDVRLLDNVGTYHGFDANFNADVTRRSIAERVGFLQSCFEK